MFGLRYLFGYESESVSKKELVILMKAELVPTLQERITQRTKGEDLYNRWRDDQLKRDKSMHDVSGK